MEVIQYRRGQIVYDADDVDIENLHIVVSGEFEILTQLRFGISTSLHSIGLATRYYHFGDEKLLAIAKRVNRVQCVSENGCAYAVSALHFTEALGNRLQNFLETILQPQFADRERRRKELVKEMIGGGGGGSSSNNQRETPHTISILSQM
jgi:CRP-like cAMP-binding protein